MQALAMDEAAASWQHPSTPGGTEVNMTPPRRFVLELTPRVTPDTDHAPYMLPAVFAVSAISPGADELDVGSAARRLLIDLGNELRLTATRLLNGDPDPFGDALVAAIWKIAEP